MIGNLFKNVNQTHGNFMRMREEWKVKRSGRIASRARSIAGISVSIVTLELGTIWPMRMGRVTITPSQSDCAAGRFFRRRIQPHRPAT